MKKFVIALLLLLISTPAFALQTIELLAATTGATQSNTFVVEQGQPVTVIFTGTVGAGETGTIQVSYDDGSTWVNAADQLTDSDLIKVIVGPGLFRINKSATAAAAGITIAQ